MKDRKIFDSINLERKKVGLKEFEWSDICASVADEHTNDMAIGKVPFSHDNWKARYIRIHQLIPKIKSGSENVAMSSPDEFDPVTSWLKSTGHKKNMLSKCRLCGTAHVALNGKHFYTAIFMEQA